MPKKTRDQADKDFKEFLKDAKHQKRDNSKPDAVDGHAVREDPDWRKEGKDAPPGWVKRGDTYEEE